MNSRPFHGVLIVLLAPGAPQPERSLLPAASTVPPEELAAQLRAANILAWPRRRDHRPFAREFITVGMPAPWAAWTVRRRRTGLSPGRRG